jgi:hypothetical protein
MAREQGSREKLNAISRITPRLFLGIGAGIVALGSGHSTRRISSRNFLQMRGGLSHSHRSVTTFGNPPHALPKIKKVRSLVPTT